MISSGPVPLSSVHLKNASTIISYNLTSTAHFAKTLELSLRLDSSSPKILLFQKPFDLLLYVHNSIIL
jgi:hypothetical protein